MKQLDAEFEIIVGDVLDTQELVDGKFDAVLCDPPYGLGDPLSGESLHGMLEEWLQNREAEAGGSGFMASEWDRVQGPAKWNAIQSVCKPGAFLASFGGTRTFDLQCVAQRLAGWEMRDEILALAWTYGSGFPKSHDVSKAIDKMKGAEREQYAVQRDRDTSVVKNGVQNIKCSVCGCTKIDSEGLVCDHPTDSGPATPEAEQWDGYGTALAPAHEPIGLWRNPTDQTYAECALEEGCGALNIDGGRVETEEELSIGSEKIGATTYGDFSHNDAGEQHPGGRWPSNLAICHHPACGAECVEACHVRVMDGQSGDLDAGVAGTRSDGVGMFETPGHDHWGGYDDSGGASRFFPRFRYNAKAAKAEREAGLHTRDQVTVDDGRDEPIDNPYQRGETDRRNPHPTVKPIELCEWVARLLLPPEREDTRTLLVPYSGSGSEVIAAMLAGWDRVVGIERNEEYAHIAGARCEWWQQHGRQAIDRHRGELKQKEKQEETGQSTIFDLEG